MGHSICNVHWFIGIVLSISYMTLACNTNKEAFLEEKVYFSDVVAYGKVEDIVIGGYMVDRKFTRFEIYCTFKGGRLSRFINITEGDSDECYDSMKFRVGETYMVYLKDGYYYTPSYYADNMGNYAQDMLEEMTVICGVDFNYPLGTNKDDAVCPDPATYDYDCIGYIPTGRPDGDTMQLATPRDNGSYVLLLEKNSNSAGRVLTLPSDWIPVLLFCWMCGLSE